MSSNPSMYPMVAIVAADPSELARTRQILIDSDRAQVVATARERAEIANLMASDPDIVLLDCDTVGDDLAVVIQLIHEYSPRCQVILMNSAEGGVDLSRAMRVGVRGIVSKPVLPEDLVPLVQEVFDTEMRRTSRIEEVARQRATQGRNGDVITVFSPKGGVGCTTIASNLAIALINITRSKVALIDFSLQFGDVGVVLNLHSPHGVHELMRHHEDLDNGILDDVMVMHQSGVRVLLPPPTLAHVEEIDTEGLTAVLKALKRYYDYIVVDMWHSIEEATLAIMDMSSTLLVVTTPEVPSLRSTRRLLDLLRERPDMRGKVQVVVNRYPSKIAVGMRDIELSLGVSPVAAIPSDGKLITTAINEGVSVLNKRSPVSDSLVRLATHLAQPRIARERRTADGVSRNPSAQGSAPRTKAT